MLAPLCVFHHLATISITNFSQPPASSHPLHPYPVHTAMTFQNPNLNRRDFLRQTFAFSALATLGARTGLALPPDRQAHHVLLIGDWGKDGGHAGQSSVAASMVNYAATNHLPVDALFMLGDTWYGALPGGVDDPRWKSQFEDMYPASAFPGPAFSIMGNHDYQVMPMPKTEAELAYARRGHTRWTQPALYYSFHLPAKDPLIKVIALDSNVSTGHEDSNGFFTMSASAQAEQLQWFAAEIAKPSPAPFLVVMGHHPIFSNGPHGDHKVLIREWEPLLRRHQAHLYLAGHDHDLQHLEFADHPTSFVCSGAGGADLYDLKIAEAARGPFANKVYGFTHLEATADKLTLRHIDAKGNVLHAFTKAQDHSIAMLS
jgi:tartrate-resistant acid phosphatase type 5